MYAECIKKYIYAVYDGRSKLCYGPNNGRSIKIDLVSLNSGVGVRLPHPSVISPYLPHTVKVKGKPLWTRMHSRYVQLWSSFSMKQLTSFITLQYSFVLLYELYYSSKIYVCLCINNFIILLKAKKNWFILWKVEKYNSKRSLLWSNWTIFLLV